MNNPVLYCGFRVRAHAAIACADAPVSGVLATIVIVSRKIHARIATDVCTSSYNAASTPATDLAMGHTTAESPNSVPSWKDSHPYLRRLRLLVKS